MAYGNLPAVAMFPRFLTVLELAFSDAVPILCLRGSFLDRRSDGSEMCKSQNTYE